MNASNSNIAFSLWFNVNTRKSDGEAFVTARLCENHKQENEWVEVKSHQIRLTQEDQDAFLSVTYENTQAELPQSAIAKMGLDKFCEGITTASGLGGFESVFAGILDVSEQQRTLKAGLIHQIKYWAMGEDGWKKVSLAELNQHKEAESLNETADIRF